MPSVLLASHGSPSLTHSGHDDLATHGICWLCLSKSKGEIDKHLWLVTSASLSLKAISLNVQSNLKQFKSSIYMN